MSSSLILSSLELNAIEAEEDYVGTYVVLVALLTRIIPNNFRVFDGSPNASVLSELRDEGGIFPLVGEVGLFRSDSSPWASLAPFKLGGMN